MICLLGFWWGGRGLDVAEYYSINFLSKQSLKNFVFAGGGHFSIKYVPSIRLHQSIFWFSCGPFNQNNLINYSINLPSPRSSLCGFHSNKSLIHYQTTNFAFVIFCLQASPYPVAAVLRLALAFLSTVPTRPDMMEYSTQGHIPPVTQQLLPSQG